MFQSGTIQGWTFCGDAHFVPTIRQPEFFKHSCQMLSTLLNLRQRRSGVHAMWMKDLVTHAILSIKTICHPQWHNQELMQVERGFESSLAHILTSNPYLMVNALQAITTKECRSLQLFHYNINSWNQKTILIVWNTRVNTHLLRAILVFNQENRWAVRLDKTSPFSHNLFLSCCTCSIACPQIVCEKLSQVRHLKSNLCTL